jgi:HEAT repeat protein
LFTLFVGVWFAAWRLNQPEPIYGDQPLSYWMTRMADPTTSIEASSVLREMGPEALPVLVDALHTRSSRASDFAYIIAAKVRLAPERTYDAPNIRATAAYLLGQMRTNATPAVPDLIEALGDKDALVRLKSIRALAQIGEPSLNSLTNALVRPESLVRFGSVKALGSMGTRARSAAPALTVCLNDSQADVRQAATQALVAIRK